MYKNCGVCGQSLDPEPGFYFGAMYVSYGFNVAFMVAFFIATRVLLAPDELWVYIAAIIIPSALLFPANFRLSRSIYLHLFGGINYRPEAAEAFKSKNL